jgi:YD repeat-containing protein
LQNIAYTYNERGWLLSSSAPLFAMQLYYNTNTTGKAYNGNIMYQYWGTPGSLTHYYMYSYDALNRILGGVSDQNNNEKNMAYDQMGNLTALNRYTTNTLTDQLSYTYTGNQLTSVADATGSNTGLPGGTTNYLYDGNGNMLSQTNTANTALNKTVNTYNLLNLPQLITVPTGTITYTYDAAGNKLRKVAVINSVSTVTDYIGGMNNIVF